METKYSLVGTLIFPNCLLFSCIRPTLSCVLFNQRAGNKDAILDACIMFRCSTMQFSVGVTLRIHPKDTWTRWTSSCRLKPVSWGCKGSATLAALKVSCPARPGHAWIGQNRAPNGNQTHTHTEIWAMLTTVDGAATALWDDPHKCKCSKFRCFVFYIQTGRIKSSFLERGCCFHLKGWLSPN